MNSALQGEGRAASLEDAAPDWVRLFIGERGEAQGRPARLPACLNHLGRRRPTILENAFGWDCNQTWIFDEPQNETSEDLLVREKALGCDPEAGNTAQDESSRRP